MYRTSSYEVVWLASRDAELIKLSKCIIIIVHVFVKEEPLRYAIIKSLLTGTISIASKIGDIIEIVSNAPAENFLFTLGDIDEFIGKIEMLISLSKRGFRYKIKIPCNKFV